MTLYGATVFLHVMAVAGLFSTLTLEALSHRKVSHATTLEQAREWAGVWRLLIAVGLPSTLLALATGIYLATVTQAWESGWVRVAVPSLVLVIVGGAIAGPKRSRLAAALSAPAAVLDEPVRALMRHPIFVASLRWRAAVLVGLVFEMTARPAAPLAYEVMGAWLVAGLLLGALAWSPSARTARASG